LKSSSFEYSRVFSGWSLESVTSAIRAGVGVALLNRKRVPEIGIEWDRGSEFPIPTNVALVTRLSPGEASSLAVELAGEINRELADLD
jgi:hypothetical protein